MGGKIVSDKLIGKYVTLREVTVDDAVVMQINQSFSIKQNTILKIK